MAKTPTDRVPQRLEKSPSQQTIFCLPKIRKINFHTDSHQTKTPQLKETAVKTVAYSGFLKKLLSHRALIPQVDRS